MIRYAQKSDAPHIANIQVVTWRNAYKGIISHSYLSQLSVDKQTASWLNQIEDEQTQVIVSENNEVVTGFLSGGNCRDLNLESHSEIYAIYVTPERQNKGLGKSLVVFFLSSQSQPCSLWVLTENHLSISFYESLGFKADGTLKNLTICNEQIGESRYIKQ